MLAFCINHIRNVALIFGLLVGLNFVLGGCGEEPEPTKEGIIRAIPEPKEDIRATLEHFATAFAKEDIEGAMECFSPNYRSPSGQATKAKVRKLLENTFEGWEMTKSTITITDMDIQVNEATVMATHTYSHIEVPEEPYSAYSRTLENHSVFYLENMGDEWLIYAWAEGPAGAITTAPYPVIAGQIAYFRAYTKDERGNHNLASIKNLGGTKGGIQPKVEIFNEEKFEGSFIVPNLPFEDYEIRFLLTNSEDEKFKISHPLVIGMEVVEVR